MGYHCYRRYFQLRWWIGNDVVPTYDPRLSILHFFSNFFIQLCHGIRHQCQDMWTSRDCRSHLFECPWCTGMRRASFCHVGQEVFHSGMVQRQAPRAHVVSISEWWVRACQRHGESTFVRGPPLWIRLLGLFLFSTLLIFNAQSWGCRPCDCSIVVEPRWLQGRQLIHGWFAAHGQWLGLWG